MIRSLIKITATNHGTDWWHITNKYLFEEVYKILAWNEIIFVRDNAGIWFEYDVGDLNNIDQRDIIDMLERLRVLLGMKQWPKMKNVNSKYTQINTKLTPN